MAEKKVVLSPLSEAQRERVKRSWFEEVDNDGTLEDHEKVMLLENTGNMADLEKAAIITKAYLLKRIINGTCLAAEINRYIALK